MAVSRPIAARLTGILPGFVGDRDLAVRAYGLRERMTPGMIERPRGTDDWLLLAGEGTIDLGGGASPAGALVVWPPGHPHRYGDPTRRWTHTWLHVRGRLLDAELRGAAFPAGVALAGVDPRWLDRCVLALHGELVAQARPDAVILRNAVHSFLRQAARARLGGSGAPRALVEARAFVEQAYAQPLTLADIARRAGCSPGRLCAQWRRWFAGSPVAHLIAVRLGHGRRLLTDHRLPVAEAARSVGYDDWRQFSKLFRRRYGHPPRAARG